VNLGLRSKISQTQELIRKLEVAVRENTHQAAHLEKCRSNIMRVRSTMMEPLAQCKKRIGFRASIPKQTPEGDAEPEDTVTLALEQEQAALTAIIEQMKTKADALGEMLERHHVAKYAPSPRCALPHTHTTGQNALMVISLICCACQAVRRGGVLCVVDVGR
jgi:hypothetical protein